MEGSLWKNETPLLAKHKGLWSREQMMSCALPNIETLDGLFLQLFDPRTVQHSTRSCALLRPKMFYYFI